MAIEQYRGDDFEKIRRIVEETCKLWEESATSEAERDAYHRVRQYLGDSLNYRLHAIIDWCDAKARNDMQIIEEKKHVMSYETLKHWMDGYCVYKSMAIYLRRYERYV